MSVISKLVMLAAGKGTSPYWAFLTTNATAVTPANNFDLDSSDNVFIPLNNFDSGVGLLKVSPEGVLLEKNKFTFSSPWTAVVSGLVVTSSGAPVLFGYADNSTWPDWKPGFQYQFSNSLSPSSFRFYRANVSQPVYAGEFLLLSGILDINNKFYFVGNWNRTSSGSGQQNYSLFTHTTSSFSTVGTFYLGALSSSGMGIAANKTLVAGSGYNVWCMFNSSGSSIARNYANSSGSFGSVTNAYLLNNANFRSHVGHAVTSSNHLYTFSTNGQGLRFTPNGASAINLSNAYVWSAPSGFDSFSYVFSIYETIDSTEYIVVQGTCRHTASGRTGVFFIKYDLSFNFINGTLITNSTSSMSARGIRLDSGKNVIMSAVLGNQTVVIKLPNDSSISGSSGDWNVYTFSAPTRSAGTATLSTHPGYNSGSGGTTADDTATRTFSSPDISSATANL